ncbi:MAG TPA: sigma 54-interacting transcriptional regulator [Nitrospiria bacterium]|jgi:formate hydrogenlyase transcriptional activator|nr:sigma 54-interacting transcriptional regulator [Nitrospiria bacterium]
MDPQDQSAEYSVLQADSRQYQTLLEVSKSIAAHRDLKALLQDLAKRIPSVEPFEYIGLILHDPERNRMRAYYIGTSDNDSLPPGLELPVEESAGGWVYQTQRPLVVPRLEGEARFPKVTEILRKIGAQSYCMFPLTTAVRRLGAMFIARKSPSEFKEAEKDFLQQVVNQVAVTVDNVLNYESGQLAQRQLALERDRLRLLLEVTESIASHRDPEELFRDLARRLPPVVPFDYINVVLHEPARDTMRLCFLVTAKPSTFKLGQELSIDESPGGLVWKTQQPLSVNDIAQERRFPWLMTKLRENGVQSFCVVPLTTAQRRLGAMGFGTFQKRAYQEAELTFMRQVANQVAVAVDNALNYEAVQASQQKLARERDRQQLLLEINNAVVSNLELEDVFTAISASLRKVIQHDGSSLVLYNPETGLLRVHVLDFANNTSFVEEKQADSNCNSPAGIAIASGEPELFGEQDLKRMSSECQMAQRLIAVGVKSLCCIPLFSHNRVLGTLNLGRRRDDAFGREEVDLLRQAAQQIAIAVENGLAYREIAELKEKLDKEKLYLEEEIRTEYNFEQIIGESAALKRILKQVETVSPTDSTVLIQGETGTGKELIARAIHNLSGRRERTFVKMNCAAIPTGLLESELFGHEKGAFTGAIAQKVGRFELAHQGTIFLDEVGDIPLELQSKLLRVIQEQEFERLGSTKTIKVNVRLVAATNQALAQMVADKRFRGDLYYRLNVFPIRVPPLRERPEDIPLLVRYFAQQYSRQMKKEIETIPAETMTELSRYHWPGNIRELENLIERSVILSQGPDLRVSLGEFKMQTTPASDGEATLEAAERKHILNALRETNWVIGGPSGAAARLGMKRTTLQSKIQKLGISRHT